MNHFVAELIHFDMFGYLTGKHLISGSQKGKPPPRGERRPKQPSRQMHETEYDVVIAEFIRSKGVTRCPTACVSPTQASVAAADRAELEEYALARNRSRRAKITTRARSPSLPGYSS